jgi:hypothetical protein
LTNLVQVDDVGELDGVVAALADGLPLKHKTENVV